MHNDWCLQQVVPNTAANNTALGSGALYTNTTGTQNTALGGGVYGSTQVL